MTIAWFGNCALVGACLFAFLQSFMPLWGYWHKNIDGLACARTGALGQIVFVMFAYLLLTLAFLQNDFSVAYVANNSHPKLPLLYRLTAVWGAHEGSILLWTLILNLWTLAFYVVSKKKQNDINTDESVTLTFAILGLISFCFLLFLLLTSNPFILAIGEQTGHDLNPLLQDPGFVIHPPMLYAGYVGFSVAFALTQAALLTGKLDTLWATTTRHFTLAAWCLLTMGIMLGSWWAYRVLGWGGFWFWDPVENASLLPWLAGTALLHVLVLAEKRRTGQNWAALIAIICFGLSLLGTFLVRSGVLISAHTFANDPARGVFLLLMLAVLFTLALIIYFTKTAKLNLGRFSFSWFSRETGLLVNSSLMMIGMLTILIGTLYPLILEALDLGSISVGAPYFNLVMLPLVCLLMMMMGAVPFCCWREQRLSVFWQQVWPKALVSGLLACLLLFCLMGNIDFVTAISLSLSFWIICSGLSSLQTLPGMSVAHTGFAILVMGIMLSALMNQEREVRIQPGESTHIGPYQFYFMNITQANGPNYRGIRADFNVMKNKHPIALLQPEKRIYQVREMVMTKVAIHPGIFRDLYIALGEPLEGETWSVRLYYKPFIRFIWFGGLIMIIGGLFSYRKSSAKQRERDNKVHIL